MTKIYDLPFGNRTDPVLPPDLALESFRQAQADRERKKMQREDEREEAEHKKAMAKAEAETAEAEEQKKQVKSKEQEAGGVKQQAGIVVKGEFDIREGEKRAMEEAAREREARQTEQEKREKAEKEAQSSVLQSFQKEMSAMVESVKAGQKSPSEAIKEYFALRDAFEQGLPKTQTGQSLPAEIQLEMKKMDNNIQIQLEQMRDDRDRRDKEWQLTLRKWDEERELRREELNAKITGEKEKLDTIKTFGTRIGGAILEGAMGGGEETPTIASKPAIASKPEKKYIIDANQGEEGEFNCPKCNSIVGIAADTITAICANCGMSFPIRRIMRKEKTQTMPTAQTKAASEQAGEEQIQAEGEQFGQTENPESDSEYTSSAV